MKLDSRDIAILDALEADARMPVSHIARSVGLSKDAVAYRVRKLELGGVINGYYAVLNFPNLGLLRHEVGIRLQNASPGAEAGVVGYLKGRGEVESCFKCDGMWDLLFSVSSKSSFDFDAFFGAFLRRCGKHVAEREVYHVVEGHIFKRRYLGGKGNGELTYNVSQGGSRIDGIDSGIVLAMRKNPKVKLLELSKMLGVVPETVRIRVKKLIKKGIIMGFKPTLDIQKLGYARHRVMLEIGGSRRTRPIREYSRKSRNVVGYCRTVGRFDAWIDFEVRDQAEFRNIVWGIRRRLSKSLKKHESLHVYKRVK